MLYCMCTAQNYQRIKNPTFYNMGLHYVHTATQNAN